MRRTGSAGAVRRAVLALAVSTPVAAGIVAVAPDTATATPACATTVVDSAHVLGAAPATRAALRTFAADGDGATVYVRTYSSLPGRDPGAQEKRLEQACGSWRNAEGVRSQTLVSIIVDTGDRKTGLFYGGRWTDSLGPTYRTIETGSMNPLFARHEFDAGVAAGLTAVVQDIESAVPSADAGTSEITAADPAMAVGATEPDAGPGPVFGGFVVLVVVVFAGVGISGLVRRGRALSPARHRDTTGAQPFVGAPFVSGLDGSNSRHHDGGHGGFSGGGGFTGGSGFSGGDGGGGGGGSSSW